MDDVPHRRQDSFTRFDTASFFGLEATFPATADGFEAAPGPPDRPHRAPRSVNAPSSSPRSMNSCS